MRLCRFIVIVFLSLGLRLNAQICPLPQAVDFTATDIHGNDIHLFDILDRGQAVFLHFFSNTNIYNYLMPHINEAFSIMGCNMHEVFFIDVTHHENTQDCLWWVEYRHVAYPVIASDTGGTEIYDTYGITASPTLVLIMPDRSITIHGSNELYPSSTDRIVNALMQYGGLEPHPCTGALSVINDTVMVLGSETITPGRLEIANLSAEEVAVNAFSTDPQFNLQCLHENVDVTQGTVLIPSGQSATFMVYASLNSKDIHHGIIHIHTSAGDFETNLVILETVSTTETSPQTLTIYPNPARDHVTLQSDNLGNIQIHNLMGQLIDEFHCPEKTMVIPTENYPAGIYYVKTSSGSTKRLIITTK